ncbi:MAG: alpha/beta hydrolase [Lachnospiraceae bacterium]
MFSKAGQEFADLSEEKVLLNSKFTEKRKLYGEKIKLSCRSGLRDAVIYKSKKRNPAPVIFEMYGGCFSQGCVDNDDRMRCRMHTVTDYTIIGLDYRKSPRYPYPCGIEDVFDAICYVHAHAEEFGIDTDKMAVWGHSAGGNFACVLALLAKETGKFSLKAQLLDYPYLDAYIDGKEKTTSKTGLTAETLDCMNEIYADKETRHTRYLSPIYATQEELAGIAPAAIVICGVDPLGAEAEKMAGNLIRAGVPVLAKKFLGASHGFLEHWFFKEWYMDNLSPEERAGIPENIEELAEEGMQFLTSAAKYFLEE